MSSLNAKDRVSAMSVAYSPMAAPLPALLAPDVILTSASITLKRRARVQAAEKLAEDA